MMMKRLNGRVLLATACAGLALGLAFVATPDQALAHKETHTAQQMKQFEAIFMQQVSNGDLLFHGDGAIQEKLDVKLSNTGTACAMCHPFASDTHPASFPKWQEQMSKFATLREMINWCIEKPGEGNVIDTDGEAMKALEAYITWSNRNSPLVPGKH